MLFEPLIQPAVMHAQADRTGAFLSQGNLLVRLDPYEETQSQIAYTSTDIIDYVRTSERTLVRAADGVCQVYDSNSGKLLADVTSAAGRVDFTALGGDYIAFADRETSLL